MRRIIIASMVTGLMCGANAQADDDQTALGGTIAPSCFVGGVDVAMEFANIAIGEMVSDNTVTILCNDADGANLSLRSSQGGLESDDNDAEEIEYIAKLTNAVIGGGYLELNTGPADGNNDVEAETILSASTQLAAGSGGSLTVTLLENGTYAGGYSDTLSINVEAK